jgi:ribosomal protein L44E
MRIQVTQPNTFTGDDLIVGEWYEAMLADDHTGQQNKTFHALLQVYWASGCHSYNVRSMKQFKIVIKNNLGEGKEKYYQVYDDYGNFLDKPKIGYRSKSTKKYTKAQFANLITNLIAEMIQAGVNSKKFYEIVDTLEKNSMNRMAG